MWAFGLGSRAHIKPCAKIASAVVLAAEPYASTQSHIHKYIGPSIPRPNIPCRCFESLLDSKDADPCNFPAGVGIQNPARLLLPHPKTQLQVDSNGCPTPNASFESPVTGACSTVREFPKIGDPDI